MMPALVITDARQRQAATAGGKSTTKSRLADGVHLRTFRAEYGAKARAGLLLHTGSTLDWRRACWLRRGGGCCEEEQTAFTTVNRRRDSHPAVRA